MKLYNTASRSIEELQTIEENLVKLYACGPTVYDYTHLGHLRKYVLDDLLIRTLRHAGYEVKHVQNITDVGHLVSDDDVGEDKLEKGAKRFGTSAEAVARRFEDYFFYSMDLLGVLRPSLSCRATDHIQAQLEMVLALEKKGLTYVIENDGVYFDTSKIDDYGKLINKDPVLAKQILTAQREGQRVEKVPGRKHPTDFALWKFEKAGENRQMVWPSPWHERSFPGWHIECSAMALEHLGEQIDIHTGGKEHINIHHTNEIAQSEAATGKKPFSRYWVHHNHLFIDGQKMSKSLNNFYTIDDVIEKGFSPKALRLLFLMSHYRSEQNFTWDSLSAAQKAYLKLARFVLNLRASERNKELELSDFPAALQLHRDFFAALENDLKSNEALTVVWELLNSAFDTDILYRLIMEFDQVLGLGLAALNEENFLETVNNSLAKGIIDQDFAHSLGLKRDVLALADLPNSIQELIKQRQIARRAQNFAQADELREQLKNQGYEILDAENEELLIRKIKH